MILETLYLNDDKVLDLMFRLKRSRLGLMEAFIEHFIKALLIIFSAAPIPLRQILTQNTHSCTFLACHIHPRFDGWSWLKASKMYRK